MGRRKIAVITLCTPDLNFGQYSKENSTLYCNKNGYDFLFYENLIDKEACPICNKSAIVLENIHKYDWIFMKDVDSLFYNFDKKLEDYIDENYRYIGSCCKNGIDINLGHVLYKCDKRTEIELSKVRDTIKERISSKGEQGIYSKFWRKKRISPPKYLKKNIFNASPIALPEWNKEFKYHVDYIKKNLKEESFEAFSDVREETFIVHWMTNFLKTRILPGKVKFENVVFDLNDKQLSQFIEYHESIKEKWGYR